MRSGLFREEQAFSAEIGSFCGLRSWLIQQQEMEESRSSRGKKYREARFARAKSSPVPKKGELEMKKLYDRTIGGYYVMSVIAGLLLAFTVMAMLDVATIDGVWLVSGGSLDMLEMVWTFLPLRMFGDLSTATAPLSLAMVMAAIPAVGIFVRISGSKASRTKMQQAMATAFFVLLLMLAFAWVLHPWGRNRAFALVPVLVMVIPLMALKRTQQEHKNLSQMMPEVSEFVRKVWNSSPILQKVCLVSSLAVIVVLIVLGIIGWITGADLSLRLL